MAVNDAPPFVDGYPLPAAGLNSLAPLDGPDFTSVAITPAAGTTTALTITQTATGTVPPASYVLTASGYTWPLNFINVSSDDVAASNATLPTGVSTVVDGLTVSHNFGGGSAKGSRTAVSANMVMTATTGNASETTYNQYYPAILSTAIAEANDGGAAGAQRGDLYGLGIQAALHSGATYWAGIQGIEIDIAAAGVGLNNKVGVQVALLPPDSVQGLNLDTALLFSSQAASSPGWKQGITFGLPVGQGYWPFALTASLIGTYGAPSPVVNGVDFSAVPFSGSAFKSPGFAVDGAGSVTASGIVLSAAAAPATPAAGKFVVYMDISDNKLKAKGPNGTVTELASP